MRFAYILIKVEPGKLKAVADKLIEIEEITEVYSTSGAYDLLAKVMVENFDQFGELIPQKIHSLAGIKETYTLITFNAFK
jgi:DNA-binding Lrp family transcriptional regulator